MTSQQTPIIKGNINELFCYLLFLHIKNDKSKVKVHFNGKKVSILNLEIVHNNYGGSQKSDLLVKINFENNLSQNIYIEAKNYTDSTKMNNSLKDNILEFNSKKETSEFLDMYMIFSPGQDPVNKALTHLTTYTQSKDCFFPRIRKQIESNCISKKDTKEIQKEIVNALQKEEFSIAKKKITNEEKEIVYKKYFKDNELFSIIGNHFLLKIKEYIEDSFQHYIQDDVFEKHCYLTMYEKPDIEKLENYETIIKQLDNFFSQIVKNQIHLDWKTDAIKYCRSYMLKKYGYQNLMNLFEKIKKSENEVYSNLREYLNDRKFENGKNFLDNICSFFTTDNIHHLFKEYITPQFQEQNGLFYYKTKDTIHTNEDGYFILKQ